MYVRIASLQTACECVGKRGKRGMKAKDKNMLLLHISVSLMRLLTAVESLTKNTLDQG